MRRSSFPSPWLLLPMALAAASCDNPQNPVAPSQTPAALNANADATASSGRPVELSEDEPAEEPTESSPDPEDVIEPSAEPEPVSESDPPGSAPVPDAPTVGTPDTPETAPASSNDAPDADDSSPPPPPPPAPSPSEPPPPPPPPPADPDPPAEPEAPTGLMIDYEPSLSSTEVSITWTPAPEGTSVVEIGTSSGASNLGSFEVSQASFEYGDLPPGRVYTRVRTKIAGVLSDPSNEDSTHYFDFRDYIEALFLGTGPLSPTDGNHGCTATGVVRGFPAGTTVDVIASASTLSSGELSAVSSTASKTSYATAGAITAAFSQTSDADPVPVRDQMTVTIQPNASSQGCPSNAGCALHTWIGGASGGLYHSTRALLSDGHPARATSHEVGHGVIGLCHVDGNRIGGARHSLMSAGPGVYSGDLSPALSDYDLAASRAVYQAGIRPGDRRSQLLAARLVKP